MGEQVRSGLVWTVKSGVPDGWFRLVDLDDYQLGEIASGRLPDGARVLISAAESTDFSAASIRSAVCPHLGADLSTCATRLGGTRLRCDFHGHRFDVRADASHPTRLDGEYAGIVVDNGIYAYHGSTSTPGWRPEALDPVGAGPPIATRIETNDTDIRIMIEGAFDVTHFRAMHHRDVRVLSTEFVGTQATIRLRDAGPSGIETTIHFDGPTHVRQDYLFAGIQVTLRSDHGNRTDTGLETICRVWTSAEPEKGQRVWRALERSVLVERAADKRLWLNRTYDTFRPTPSDRLVKEFREWVAQFSESNEHD